MQIHFHLAPSIGAIKTRCLNDTVKDTKSRLYAGPAVIASITGVTVTQAADAIRQVRYGARWLDFPYTPPIKGTFGYEIEEGLGLLGYVGHWRNPFDQPTLAAYLNDRTGVERDHPCVVFLSTHPVAVSGGVLCDIFSDGVVIDIDDAAGRRKKVKRVFVLTKRIAPLEDRVQDAGAQDECGCQVRAAVQGSDQGRDQHPAPQAHAARGLRHSPFQRGLVLAGQPRER